MTVTNELKAAAEANARLAAEAREAIQCAENERASANAAKKAAGNEK